MQCTCSVPGTSVFFNLRHPNPHMRILHPGRFFGIFQRSRTNSFPHNLLSDPHPINPVPSISYKNSGGGAVFFLASNLLVSLLPHVTRDVHGKSVAAPRLC